MKPLQLLFSITAIVLAVQLLLGGLLTFGFITASVHIVVGFVLFILAIVTMVYAFVSKPAFKPLQRMTVALVLLLVLQIFLGFYTLDSGNQVVAWIHFVNALVIYGLVISGALMTTMMGRMPAMADEGSCGQASSREKGQ